MGWQSAAPAVNPMKNWLQELSKKDRQKNLSFFVEATMGFEPMMRVLQTLALPLGHVARALI